MPSMPSERNSRIANKNYKSRKQDAKEFQTKGEEPGTSKTKTKQNALDIFKKKYNDSIINTPEHRAKIDKIVQLYDTKAMVKKKIEEVSKEPDEEGWITVKRSRPDSLSREKALLEKSKMKEDKKKRLEANVAEVYQYRVRETKLDRLRELRKKFEQDKYKIAQMKSGRKFRPM